jgi:hypothetical protein
MVGIATFLQTSVHPGYFFPALANYRELKKKSRAAQKVNNGGSSPVETTTQVKSEC